MMPQLLPQLLPQHLRQLHQQQALHATDLFAMSCEQLFDAARKQGSKSAVEVPLWTGLRLHALPSMAGQVDTTTSARMDAPPAPPPLLKELETALIRKAVDDARGNVLQAAKALGISRATVYRRLGASSERG